MPTLALVASAALLALALAACSEQRQSSRRDDSVPPRSVDGASPRPSRPGVRFDPSALRPGEAVGELVVDSMSARRTIVDSTFVGVARFRGRMELSGWTLRHFEADLRDAASCFEADSASAARLPRWSGDERRPWFCFENHADAARALGPPSEGVRATIVIERFTIHRGISDEVNSARFVRLVRRIDAAAPSMLPPGGE